MRAARLRDALKRQENQVTDESDRPPETPGTVFA
jgi:hypothetical protein